jgi:hypothetical protein
MLCGHMIVSPDRIVAELFGVQRNANDVLWGREWQRIGQPFHAGWQASADSHIVSPRLAWFLQASLGAGGIDEAQEYPVAPFLPIVTLSLTPWVKPLSGDHGCLIVLRQMHYVAII